MRETRTSGSIDAGRGTGTPAHRPTSSAPLLDPTQSLNLSRSRAWILFVRFGARTKARARMSTGLRCVPGMALMLEVKVLCGP